MLQDNNKDSLHNTIKHFDQHAQKNASCIFDSDDHKEKSKSLNKDCIQNTNTEEIFGSINNVDYMDNVFDDNIEWVCVYKDCLYHNHIEDVSVKDEKYM